MHLSIQFTFSSLLLVCSANQQVLDPHSSLSSFSTDFYLVLFFWGLRNFLYLSVQTTFQFFFFLVLAFLVMFIDVFLISYFMFSSFPVLCIVRTFHVSILMSSVLRFILFSIWFVAGVSLVDDLIISCYIFCRTRHLFLLDRDTVDVVYFLHCLHSGHVLGYL